MKNQQEQLHSDYAGCAESQCLSFLAVDLVCIYLDGPTGFLLVVLDIPAGSMGIRFSKHRKICQSLRLPLHHVKGVRKAEKTKELHYKVKAEYTKTERNTSGNLQK